MRKEQLQNEYNIAKKMGCGAGFWSINCQQLVRLGIKK